jgi:hypothetical protein
MGRREFDIAKTELPGKLLNLKGVTALRSGALLRL